MKTSSRDLRAQVDLFRIAEGFLASSVLFALVKLGIFEAIGGGQATVDELADSTGAPHDALARLLEGGVSVDLLESPQPSTYRIRPAFVPYLVAGEGGVVLDSWFRFQSWWYEAFGRLDESVRTGAPSVADYGAELAERRELTLAMHDYASLRAKEIVRVIDADGRRSLLDVGCGPGTYAFELGLRHPRLELHLADRAEVLDVAREIGDRYELARDVHYHPVDIVEDELPGAHDLVLVSNALHVLGDDESRRLIERLYDVVEPGGELVVQAQFLGVPERASRWPVMVDLAMLCTTNEGRNHSVEDTRRWMEDAGFTDIRFHALTLFNPNACLRGRRS